MRCALRLSVVMLAGPLALVACGDDRRRTRSRPLRRRAGVEQNRQGQNISFLSTYVDASSGRMYVTARGRAEDMFQVYCVRPTDGGPLPSEVRRCFRRSPAEEQEHTLEDLGTGLVWTGCFAGLSGPDCNEGQGGAGTHRHSIRFCEDLEYAGHDDWMMPSVDQLNTLTDNVRQPNGTRLSGFMSGLFETETRLWAADRVGVNASFSDDFTHITGCHMKLQNA